MLYGSPAILVDEVVNIDSWDFDGSTVKQEMYRRQLRQVRGQGERLRTGTRVWGGGGGRRDEGAGREQVMEERVRGGRRVGRRAGRREEGSGEGGGDVRGKVRAGRSGGREVQGTEEGRDELRGEAKGRRDQPGAAGAQEAVCRGMDSRAQARGGSDAHYCAEGLAMHACLPSLS